MKTSKILLNANDGNEICVFRIKMKDGKEKLSKVHFARKWKCKVVTTFKAVSRGVLVSKKAWHD